MREERIGVLASGSGTNLQALLDRFGPGGDPAGRVVRLIASREDAGALERAERADVESRILPEEVRAGADGEARWLLASLKDAEVDIVVLAGWLRLVPGEVVRAYRGRMLNVHPALLPAFGGQGMFGRHVHEAVLAAGVRVTGMTVHFVDEAYDRGPIAAQWPVPVRTGDDVDSLARRVLRVEHRVLPETVSALARGALRLEGGRARWERAWFGGERFRLDPIPEEAVGPRRTRNPDPGAGC